jgi:UDP-N-acetylmuramyl pentapeptide phosphotransferase/UDP-N-acetylglucosamine-1-phosphate transferase
MEYIAYTLIILSLNVIIKNKGFFLSYSGFKHQKFINKSIPLTGGLFLIIPIYFIFGINDLIFMLFFLAIFFLGATSDLNILSSPKIRFVIQIILILLFVFLYKLEVLPSRIKFIDNYFLNTYWSYFFTIFCIMILLNGSNFIDGLNGLLLGYFLIIFFLITNNNLIDVSSFLKPDVNINFFLFCFLLIYILNLCNQMFLGDGGAYSVSFLIAFILIKIYSHQSLTVSPYYIILLLWYPCFENLFSIVRKILKKKSPYFPDNEHLHQYIFIFMKSKYKINSLSSNILSGVTINVFNFLILYVGSTNVGHTILQLKLLGLAVFTYTTTYILLKRFKKNT